MKENIFRHSCELWNLPAKYQGKKIKLFGHIQKLRGETPNFRWDPRSVALDLSHRWYLVSETQNREGGIETLDPGVFLEEDPRTRDPEPLLYMQIETSDPEVRRGTQHLYHRWDMRPRTSTLITKNNTI